MKDGKSGMVRFISVPAFAFKTGIEIKTEKYGAVEVDIGYGGAFYALVVDTNLQLSVLKSSVQDLVDAADIISTAVKEQLKVCHPEEEDLSFLYGTIITDGKDEFNDETTANLCIFADRQVILLFGFEI